MLNRPQVAPNVRRAIDVPVASTGAGAAAMGLSIAADAFQKERERAGQIRANAAEAEIRQVSSRLATEVEQMQRTNALGAEDFVAEKWGNEVSRITAGISDPAVREAVEARANVLRGELTSRARTHASREMERADTEDYERNQKDDLGRLASTPLPDADAIIERMRLRTTERLTNQGFSPEAKQAEVERMVSVARLAQVNALVKSDNADRAAQFLEREDVMGTMRPDDYAKAKTLVQGETMVLRAQQARDELVVEFETEAEALKAVRERYSGDMEERVRQQVRQYFGEQTQAQRQAIQSNTDEALRGIVDGRGIPAEARRFLYENDPKTLSELESYQTTRARGDQPETDLNVWGDLIKMAATNPQEFVKLDPRTYRNQLDDTHYERLVTMQAGAMKPQGGKLSPFAINQFVWQEARRNNLVPPDAASMSDLNRRKEAKERFLLLQEAAQDAVTTLLESNPRATPAEQRAVMQSVINNQVLVESGGILGYRTTQTAMPAGAVRPTDRVVGAVQRKPIGERVAELKASGVSKEVALQTLRAEGYTEQEMNP
jgi:hypothetical protein